MEATWNVENSVKLYRLKVGPDINILPNKVGWCQLYLDLDKTGSDRVILCSINWYITKGLYRLLLDIVIEGWLRRNTKALPTTSELNSDPDMASLVSLPCLSAPSSLFCAIKGTSTRLGCTVFTLISPSSYSRSQLFRIPPPSPARHHSPPTGHDHNHDSQTSSPPCGETTTISSPRNIGQGSCSTCTVTQDNLASFTRTSTSYFMALTASTLFTTPAFAADALTTNFQLTMSWFGVPDHEPQLAPLTSQGACPGDNQWILITRILLFWGAVRWVRALIAMLIAAWCWCW